MNQSNNWQKSEKQVVHDRLASGLGNWGCEKLPSGEPIYEGEEIVRVVATGKEMSAATAKKEGYEFID